MKTLRTMICHASFLAVLLCGTVAFGQYADAPYCNDCAVGDGGAGVDHTWPSLPFGMSDAHFWAGYTQGNTDRSDVRVGQGTLPSPIASVAFDGGYSTVGGFFPYYTQFPNGNWFIQAEWHYTDQDQNMANIGVGRRFMLDERMYGMSLWYDFDEAANDNLSEGRPFHQFGINVETRGPYFDMFMNWYQPVGDKSYFTGSIDGGAGFFQNDVLIQSGLDLAMEGFDAEIQVAVPFMDYLDPHASFGGYAFQNDDGDRRFTGYFGRFTFNPTPRSSFNVRINQDDTNNTTVAAQVAFTLGSSRRYACGNQLLDLPVRRMDHIVRFQQDQVVAINPKTGLPWQVRHVDNLALPGGDGTFENPYNELASVNGPLTGVSGSLPNDILFVNVGSGTNLNYDAEVVLQDCQLLLGQGTRHFIDTVQVGNFELPGFIQGPNGERLAPEITATGGTAVTLADMNRVSGFEIDNANIAIAGNTITDFNINNNIIDNTVNDAITITDASGTGMIFENDIEDSGGNAITLASTGVGTTLNATITANDLQRSQGDGLNLTVNNGDIWTITANGNQIEDNQNGVVANINGTGRLTLNLTDNDIDDSLDAGVRAILNGTTAGLQGTITMNNNDLNDNQMFGVDLQMVAGNTAAMQVDTLGDEIDDTGLGTTLQGLGINAEVQGGALTLNINNTDITDTDASGTGLAANRQGAVNLISGNTGTIAATITGGSNISRTLGASGVHLNSQGAGDTLTVTNSNLLTNTVGASVLTGGAASSTININSGQLSQSTQRGFDGTFAGTGTTALGISGTQITANAQGGVLINASSTGTLNATISGATFNTNNGDDINIATIGSVLANASILNNTINSTNAGNGIVTTAGGSSNVGLVITGNTANGGAANNGLALTTTGQANIWATLTGANTFQNYATGILAAANNTTASRGIAMNFTGTTTLTNNATQDMNLSNSNAGEMFAWVDSVTATGSPLGIVATSNVAATGRMHLRLSNNSVNTGNAANDYSLTNNVNNAFSFDLANSNGNTGTLGGVTAAALLGGIGPNAVVNTDNITTGSPTFLGFEFLEAPQSNAGNIGNPGSVGVTTFTPPP